MRERALLLVHLIATIAKLLLPGGARSIIAESLLKRRWKPGPKGPGPELVSAIVEMKRRNPRFGCRRIAQQIALLFGVEIDKDVVRRVLAKYGRRPAAATVRPG
jgi:hypothetical protein